MTIMIISSLIMVLATARVIRLVTADTLTRPLRDRLEAWAYAPPDEAEQRRRLFLLEFVECPWCIGFWLGVISLTVFVLAGGPTDPHYWWWWVAIPFALNMITAPLVAWTSPSEDDDSAAEE